MVFIICPHCESNNVEIINNEECYTIESNVYLCNECGEVFSHNFANVKSK